MEAKSLSWIAQVCGAELKSGQPQAQALDVCTDSRQAKAGELFLAIRGERFDGHDFLNEVAARPVAAVMVEHQKLPATLPACAVLAVDDGRLALGRLASAYRREFTLPIIAVGGSNGKTTTKELLASVLRQKFCTLWNEASFNNDIGVPLTLLRLQKSHQAAVLEVGTNHPGEVAPLVRMMEPGMAVITNIGREHLEFFGDLAGVAQEEGWLAELLPADGTLFLNGDGEWVEKVAGRSRAKVVRAGFGEKNDWRATKLRLDKNGSTFQVSSPQTGQNGEYRLNLLGRHQVSNALLAIAAGAELGLSYAEIANGLAACPPPKMRMQFWEANGVRVLDDAYNANTDSMIAALETLCDLPFQGRRVAVLGDMGEQGSQSAAAHAEVGRHAARLGIGQLFAVGPLAAGTAQAARAAGLKRVIEFADVESAVTAVRKFLKSGDVVLLKASRSARLERIAESLKTEKN